MTYLNFHTHSPLHEGEQTIPSLGVHPWHIHSNWTEEVRQLESELKNSRSVQEMAEQKAEGVPTMMIGECGLDRLCATPYDIQLEVFQKHIRLSESYRLPLVLHCVRAIDDVLRLKRGTHQHWIFHGYRGKPQQLQQLIDHDFYISFGFNYNPESLRACPESRLFLETDDIPRPISPLYEEVSKLRQTTTEQLREQVWENAKGLLR